jgi:hypothetical protein
LVVSDEYWACAGEAAPAKRKASPQRARRTLDLPQGTTVFMDHPQLVIEGNNG